jgi:hypothetical protein
MAKSAKARSRTKSNAGSLLSPEAMGGITAGKGFDFQTRFAACHLPIWLLDPAFHQLFYEGTGDIDLRFQKDGQSSRVHIQVKDHEVTPSELKGVIKHFRNLDEGMPNTYIRFALVCPSLSPKLQPTETGLARFRNAKPFYDDAPSALAPTKEELNERLHKVGLDEADCGFVYDKLSFDIGYGDFHHDDRAENFFIGRLLSHPDYATKIRVMVQPAYAELLRAIHGKQGAVLERSDVERALRDAVVATRPGERSIMLWVQNWTRETFDDAADYSLDWSEHFDRTSRRVPSPEIWSAQLLPELRSLKEKIMAERTERLIRFRGKCALSTGVVLGAAFPNIGGWIFEIPQPPSKDAWRSDAEPAILTDFQVEVEDGSNGGTDVVVGVNIRGDGREDIRRYIESTGKPPKLFAFMGPSVPSSRAIIGPEDACAFARSIRERLGEILKRHDLRHTRLFFYGPFALAVFLGQHLTSLGEVQLFEYQDPGYVPSCSLRT